MWLELSSDGPARWGVPCQQLCPHSANSLTPNKGIISPLHDIIFPFTRCLSGTICGFLSHFSFYPFIFSVSLTVVSVAFSNRSSLVCLSLPPCLPSLPLLRFSNPFLARLFSHYDLTAGLCTGVTLTLSPFRSLSLFLFVSLEENHKLISLPALFLTSRLARRILTKLRSQLTPKAHNNLLCQQMHMYADAHAHKHIYSRCKKHTVLHANSSRKMHTLDATHTILPKYNHCSLRGAHKHKIKPRLQVKDTHAHARKHARH